MLLSRNELRKAAMKTYTVKVPIAGHIIVNVEAESEEDAARKAMESDDLTLDNLDSWEALEQFNAGNVCYCPHPWEVEAELDAGQDEEAAPK